MDAYSVKQSVGIGPEKTPIIHQVWSIKSINLKLQKLIHEETGLKGSEKNQCSSGVPTKFWNESEFELQHTYTGTRSTQKAGDSKEVQYTQIKWDNVFSLNTTLNLLSGFALLPVNASGKIPFLLSYTLKRF